MDPSLGNEKYEANHPEQKRIIEIFSEAVKLISLNVTSRDHFEFRYNCWCKILRLKINLLSQTYQDYISLISPSLFPRFISTVFIFVCFFESIRNNSLACCFTGVFLCAILALMSFISTIITLASTGAKYLHTNLTWISAVSFLTEVITHKINDIQTLFQIEVRTDSLHGISRTAFCFIPRTWKHFFSLIFAYYMSWFNIYGIIVSVQFCVILNYFDFQDISEFLECFSYIMLIVFALTQDRKIKKIRKEIRERDYELNSSTKNFLEWFEQSSEVNVLLEKYESTKSDVLKLFSLDHDALKTTQLRSSFMFAVIIVNASLKLQSCVNTDNFNDVIRYILFNKRCYKSDGMQEWITLPSRYIEKDLIILIEEFCQLGKLFVELNEPASIHAEIYQKVENELLSSRTLNEVTIISDESVSLSSSSLSQIYFTGSQRRSSINVDISSDLNRESEFFEKQQSTNFEYETGENTLCNEKMFFENENNSGMKSQVDEIEKSPIEISGSEETSPSEEETVQSKIVSEIAFQNHDTKIFPYKESPNKVLDNAIIKISERNISVDFVQPSFVVKNEPDEKDIANNIVDRKVEMLANEVEIINSTQNLEDMTLEKGKKSIKVTHRNISTNKTEMPIKAVDKQTDVETIGKSKTNSVNRYGKLLDDLNLESKKTEKFARKSRSLTNLSFIENSENVFSRMIENNEYKSEENACDTHLTPINQTELNKSNKSENDGISSEYTITEDEMNTKLSQLQSETGNDLENKVLDLNFQNEAYSKYNNSIDDTESKFNEHSVCESSDKTSEINIHDLSIVDTLKVVSFDENVRGTNSEKTMNMNSFNKTLEEKPIITTLKSNIDTIDTPNKVLTSSDLQSAIVEYSPNIDSESKKLFNVKSTCNSKNKLPETRKKLLIIKKAKSKNPVHLLPSNSHNDKSKLNKFPSEMKAYDSSLAEVMESLSIDLEQLDKPKKHNNTFTDRNTENYSMNKSDVSLMDTFNFKFDEKKVNNFFIPDRELKSGTLDTTNKIKPKNIGQTYSKNVFNNHDIVEQNKVPSDISTKTKINDSFNSPESEEESSRNDISRSERNKKNIQTGKKEKKENIKTMWENIQDTTDSVKKETENKFLTRVKEKPFYLLEAPMKTRGSIGANNSEMNKIDKKVSPEISPFTLKSADKSKQKFNSFTFRKSPFGEFVNFLEAGGNSQVVQQENKTLTDSSQAIVSKQLSEIKDSWRKSNTLGEKNDVAKVFFSSNFSELNKSTQHIQQEYKAQSNYLKTSRGLDVHAIKSFAKNTQEDLGNLSMLNNERKAILQEQKASYSSENFQNIQQSIDSNQFDEREGKSSPCFDVSKTEKEDKVMEETNGSENKQLNYFDQHQFTTKDSLNNGTGGLHHFSISKRNHLQPDSEKIHQKHFNEGFTLNVKEASFGLDQSVQITLDGPSQKTHLFQADICQNCTNLKNQTTLGINTFIKNKSNSESVFNTNSSKVLKISSKEDSHLLSEEDKRFFLIKKDQKNDSKYIYSYTRIFKKRSENVEEFLYGDSKSLYFKKYAGIRVQPKDIKKISSHFQMQKGESVTLLRNEPSCTAVLLSENSSYLLSETHEIIDEIKQHESNVDVNHSNKIDYDHNQPVTEELKKDQENQQHFETYTEAQSTIDGSKNQDTESNIKTHLTEIKNEDIVGDYLKDHHLLSNVPRNQNSLHDFQLNFSKRSISECEEKEAASSFHHSFQENVTQNIENALKISDSNSIDASSQLDNKNSYPSFQHNFEFSNTWENEKDSKEYSKFQDREEGFSYYENNKRITGPFEENSRERTENTFDPEYSTDLSRTSSTQDIDIQSFSECRIERKKKRSLPKCFKKKSSTHSKSRSYFKEALTSKKIHWDDNKCLVEDQKASEKGCCTVMINNDSQAILNQNGGFADESEKDEMKHIDPICCLNCKNLDLKLYKPLSNITLHFKYNDYKENAVTERTIESGYNASVLSQHTNPEHSSAIENTGDSTAGSSNQFSISDNGKISGTVSIANNKTLHFQSNDVEIKLELTSHPKAVNFDYNQMSGRKQINLKDKDKELFVDTGKVSRNM
ncbi:uncharacterized protein NPIL_655231 [Nephila pilipes]|uniref:Uncharacterized protein n=1 Tax=Nephila pilipes TaxID=299642 RepID=A0A8X6MKW1_NEPPI|nr:uncharacterized protein NPIL_655231 [Nephila pilipes]